MKRSFRSKKNSKLARKFTNDDQHDTDHQIDLNVQQKSHQLCEENNKEWMALKGMNIYKLLFIT